MNQTPPPAQTERLSITLSKRIVWVWTALLVGPWILVAVAIGPHWARLCAEAWQARNENGKGAIHHCKPGPWGHLEFVRLAIEPPEEYVAAWLAPHKPVEWFFRGYKPPMLSQLWSEAGLSGKQQQALMASAEWNLAAGTVVIKPSDELILDLSPAARKRIYDVLALFPENPHHANPYRYRANMLDEWFTDSGLSPRTEALIRRLLYFRGTAALFSDHEMLMKQIGTPQERARALKTLARSATVLAKLRVYPNSDFEQLINYWGRGRRSKDVGPLLTSLPKLRNGFTIDVAHLLPAFARRRLYTYPNPDTDPTTPRQDCHWTAMNFFNETPDERFLSPEKVREVLEQDYYPVPGEPIFGDVILLMASATEVVHSCVYVADTLVFTKNGSQPYVPWKLMELSDVLALYSIEGRALETRFMRDKRL